MNRGDFVFHSTRNNVVRCCVRACASAFFVFRLLSLRVRRTLLFLARVLSTIILRMLSCSFLDSIIFNTYIESVAFALAAPLTSNRTIHTRRRALARWSAQISRMKVIQRGERANNTRVITSECVLSIAHRWKSQTEVS